MSGPWHSVPFWSIARRVERTGDPDAELLSVYRDHGVVRRTGRDDNFNKASEDLSTYKVVRRGDLVLNKMKTWQGSLGVSPYDGIVSPAYFVCSLSSEVDGRFIHHLLRSRPYIALYEANSKGIRPNQWDLPYDALRQIPVLLPRLDEQRRIADFLDNQVARIDQIIAARRKQTIELRSLAHGSMSERMDDLGRRYGLAPLRRFCAGIEQGSSPVGEDRPAGNGECGVLKTSAIKSGRFDSNSNKAVPEHLAEDRFRIASGDLLVTRGSGSADLVGDAAVALVNDASRLYLSDLTYRLRDVRLKPEFAALAITSARGRAELGSRVRQGSGPAKARGDDILSLPVPAAPRDQQDLAADAAAATLEDMERRVGQLRESIDALQEYKAALITAAVTGDLDVATAGSGVPG